MAFRALTFAVAILSLTLCYAAHASRVTAFPILKFTGADLQQSVSMSRNLAHTRLSKVRTSASSAPAVTSASILTTTLAAGAPPSAPALQLSVAGQVNSVSFSFLSPNGQYVSYDYYSDIPISSNPLTLQGSVFPYGNGAISPYAQPGKWKIDYIIVSNSSGGYTSYYGSNATKLFSGPTSIKVTNRNTPDTQPPVFSEGDILTPTVSQNGVFEVNLNVSDNLSGVDYLEIELGPTGCNGGVFGFVVEPPAPITSSQTFLFATTIGSYLSPGSYQVCGVSFFDAASNTYQNYNPATLSQLFPNGTSVTITN